MVSSFVRSGLEAGDRVWCFPNGGRSDVLGWLRRDDLAVDDVMASGQLDVQPAHESPLTALASHPERVIDCLRAAVDDATSCGWGGFRIIGDLGWTNRGRHCPGRLLDFETRVGDMLATLPATALCQYDRYRFDAATMVALTTLHRGVVGTLTVPIGDDLVISPWAGGAGLRLVGEIDLCTHECLRAALEDAVHGRGDLHLELSGLAFIDLGGVAVVLRAADRLGPGRQMVVHQAPHSLRLALDLLWPTSNLVEAEPV